MAVPHGGWPDGKGYPERYVLYWNNEKFLPQEDGPYMGSGHLRKRLDNS